MQTIIIGGGAAGIAAALAAAEHGEQVRVLERNHKPLKKLGVTGNGRGNLLNAGEPCYYGDAAFAKAVLGRIGYPQLCAFFAQLGVPLRIEEEGRVYPAAQLASVAVDALLLRARQLGVMIQPDTQVETVAKQPDGFLISATQMEGAWQQSKTKGNKREKQPQTIARAVQYRADRVIVTVGGAAAPVHGTDGSGYALLAALGHTITPVRPALCALLTEPKPIAGLAGQRAKANLALLDADGQPLHAANGEVLFGEDAVSGIAAMQLARFVQPGAVLTIDFRPALGMLQPQQQTLPSTHEIEQLLLRLAAQRAQEPLAELLTGICAFPMARFWLAKAGLTDLRQPIRSLPRAAFSRLSQTIAACRLPITGTRGFGYAQVTAGGADTAEFSPQTMESRVCPGLYAAGEVLNVDGECGGFNLMFAFAGGLLAGGAGRG